MLTHREIARLLDFYQQIRDRQMLDLIESRILALIESGAVASVGFAQALTGTQPDASRAADTRRAATHHHDQAAFIDRGRDTKLQHQKRADSATQSTTTD